MRKWLRVGFVCVILWMLAVGVWANRSWTESLTPVAPAGVVAQERSFVCSAPFAARSVDPVGAVEADFPLPDEPCDVHRERRVLAIVDLGIGAALLVLLVYLGTRSSARKEATPVA